MGTVVGWQMVISSGQLPPTAAYNYQARLWQLRISFVVLAYYIWSFGKFW